MVDSLIFTLVSFTSMTLLWNYHFICLVLINDAEKCILLCGRPNKMWTERRLLKLIHHLLTSCKPRNCSVSTQMFWVLDGAERYSEQRLLSSYGKHDLGVIQNWLKLVFNGPFKVHIYSLTKKVFLAANDDRHTLD